MSIVPLSEADCYETPDDLPLPLRMKFTFYNRWWFYSKFIRIILDYRSTCLKNLGSDEKWVKASLQVLKVIESCGGRFTINGLDNLRKVKEPVVIISNHMSTMETMVFPIVIFPFIPITFVVKESLIKGQIFGPVMRSRKPVAVGRVNPRKDFETVLVEGTKILEKGISLIIFPQATRRVSFEPENFNSLGVKLAKRAGVKAVPAALKTDFWGNGKKLLKDFGPIDPSKRIYMSFGEPMIIEGNGKDQHQKSIEFIQSHLEKWKD
jgi:1-acyl-sn-glycerol-3-phosphate acyltransferase